MGVEIPDVQQKKLLHVNQLAMQQAVRHASTCADQHDVCIGSSTCIIRPGTIDYGVRNRTFCN